jgi:putative PIN family toxin of toxin-antitoxin system
MKIVLDTNVLVSGLLNPHGPPGRIVQLVAAGQLRLCFDARILSEYHEVILRPLFAFSPHQVRALLEQIAAVGKSVPSQPLREALPDPDDRAFLEVAIAAGGAVLVTGNARHYPEKCRGAIRVLCAREFLEAWQCEAS